MTQFNSFSFIHLLPQGDIHILSLKNKTSKYIFSYKEPVPCPISPREYLFKVHNEDGSPSEKILLVSLPLTLDVYFTARFKKFCKKTTLGKYTC